MSNELSKIEDMAQLMRAAIESIPPKELPSTMFDFPKGACDAALLLGAYFAECGIEGFVYVLGSRYSRDEHSWLAKETLVVDITADEFWDASSPIIVDDPADWHRQFRIEYEGPSDLRELSGRGVDELRRLYARIRLDLLLPSVE